MGECLALIRQTMKLIKLTLSFEETKIFFHTGPNSGGLTTKFGFAFSIF